MQVFEFKRKFEDALKLVPRHMAYRLNDGVAPRDGNRPFIPYNNPRHMQSPPMQRPYIRRPPVDSGLPPHKRGMAPDRRDEGDRYSSRPRVR